MANEVVNRRLNIFIDTPNAEANVSKLEAKIKSLEGSIERGTKAGKDMSAAIAQLGKHKSELEQLNSILDGKIRPTFTQVKTTVSNLRKELQGMSADAPGYAAKFERFKQVSAEFEKMKANIGGVRGALNSIGSQIKSVALGVLVGNTIQTAIQTLAGYFNSIFSNSGKLSDSLADIQRVTGLTAKEVNSLNDGLKKIDTRTSAEGLRNIAIIAGKLGVAKDDILGFTKAVDMLVVALGDELGDADQITTQLGKILNVFDGKVDGDNISRVGNAIVDLANKGVASGGFIVDFTQRVSSIAKAANISLPDVLALGAGIEELGGKSESGSTALIKIITDIGKDIPKAAKVAGISAKEFTKLFAEDPTKAILEYSKGLVKNKSAFTDVIASMKDAGEEGARVVTTISLLGNNADLFNKKLRETGKAFQETDKITDAFGLKNETLGARMEKVGKRIASAFSSSSLSQTLGTLVGWFDKLLDATPNVIRAYDDQEKKVKQLDSTVAPLVARYDELKSKTNLNTDEQAELQKVIQQIGETIPETINQIDEYGRILDINRIKVSDYFATNKKFLRETQRDAIDATTQSMNDFIAESKTFAQLIHENAFSADVPEFLKNLRQFQKGAIENADILINKFGIELPAATTEAINAMRAELGLSQLTTGKIILDKPTDIVKPGSKTTPTVTLTDEQKKAMEKQREEFERLREELRRLAAEFNIDNLTKYQRKIEEVNRKFDELVRKAKGSAEITATIQDLRQKALDQVASDFGPKFLDPRDIKIKGKETIEIIKEVSDGVAELGRKMGERFEHNIELGQRERLAAAELKTFTTHGIKRLEANKALLTEQEQQELAASEHTQSEIAVIHKKYAKLRAEEEIGFITKVAEQVVEVARYGEEALNSLFTIQNNNDNVQLENDRKVNDQKKKNFQKQLDGKLISQKQYDDKVAALDKEALQKENAVKKRIFERQKELQLVQAAINIAEGATKAYGQLGPLGGAAGAAIVLGLGAIQIAAIESQEYVEQYEKGGKLTGPSHKSPSKGMPVKDPVTNRTVALLEGGEGITNKRTMQDRQTYTVTGTPSQISSRLNAMHGGVNWESGAHLVPGWVDSSPRSINVGRISKSMSRMGYYAAGGVFDANGSNQVGTGNAIADPELKEMLRLLIARLNEPIAASVNYGEYEAKSKRINAIRDNGIAA